MNFDEIISLKEGDEKNEKLREWYINEVKVTEWINNPFKNNIIKYHDRTEYKKNGKYHRLNGPAIEHITYSGYSGGKSSGEDKYYYNGKLYDNVKEWKKATIKELRKLKLRKLKKLD